MAAYGSHDTATEESDDDTLTIAKPASLAANDLLVAVLASTGQTIAWDVPTNWTSLINRSSGAVNTRVLWKIADSSDASASDFTFTNADTSTMSRAGILYRITGTFGGAGNLAADGFDTSSDASPSYSSGVDPNGSTALLIMGTITATQGVTSSTYAVANNNPTWTERCDLSVNGTSDVTLSSATASYTVGTTTGNYSLALSSAVNSFGYIIAISDNENASVTPSVVTATLAVQAPTVTGSAGVSPSVITTTAAVQAPTVTTATPTWTNPDKSSAPSWNNPNKS